MYTLHNAWSNLDTNHYYYYYFIFSGSTALGGLWPHRSRGFVITLNDAQQSVGPFGRVISLSQRPLPDNTQQTNIHAQVGFFFSNP
jgi:hypothetical protein